MKIYIAGKITGLEGYKEIFKKREKILKLSGNHVMNPTILPEGFEHEEYMKICYSMIDVCEAVYFIYNWQDSKGAIMENEYAIKTGKKIIYEEFLMVKEE